MVFPSCLPVDICKPDKIHKSRHFCYSGNMVAVSKLPAVKALEDPREREFVRLVTNGIDPIRAAEQCGFNYKGANIELMSRPAVLTAIHQGVQCALVEDAPVSLKVLKELRNSGSTPARTRADISLKLLAMAGHGAKDSKGHDSKPLSEMSGAELRRYVEDNERQIQALETELVSRAKVVSAPVAQQIDAKPLTFLD
jgi:hypothetical protein